MSVATLKNMALTGIGVMLIALGGSETARSATLIDTTSSWNGVSSITPIGEAGTPTYGQTFTVGADNILTEFSFFLQNYTFFPLKFAAYILEWEGTKAGTVLWESQPQIAAANSGLKQFSFETGDTVLTSGKRYVAAFSSLNFFDRQPDAGSAGLIWSNVYSEGEFVFSNNARSFSELSQVQWDSTQFFTTQTDMAFTAKFSVPSQSRSVPEPASIFGLLAVATLGVGSLWKGNKKGKH